MFQQLRSEQDADRRDGPAELSAALEELERWGSERDWLGPDPYEGLNARRAPIIRRWPLGRRVLVQAVKRSPIDLRRLLAIEAAYNAVGAANVVSAYAASSFLPDGERRAKLDRMLEILERLRLKAFDRPCWGYHFGVETRVFFYPSTRPNTIASAFAGEALLDAYDRTGDEALLRQAAGVGRFFVEDIGATRTSDGAYFGYFIGDRTPIHNANMLVCGLLARLAGYDVEDGIREACTQGVRYCLAHQRPDGSWPYGEQPGLAWVDGFHTGYVLDALLECERAGIDPDVTPAVERGLAFYRDRLFLADGTPKYQENKVYPIDSQCVAQAIQTFSRAALGGRDYAEAAWSVFTFARRKMQRKNGGYVFQQRRYWANTTPHIRWAQAPMFLALTHLAELSSREPG